MVRNREWETSKGLFVGNDIKAAMEMVLSGCSVRRAAPLKNVNHVTSSKYVKKSKECDEENVRYAPNYSVRMVFTARQEEKLNNSLIMCYGRTTSRRLPTSCILNDRNVQNTMSSIMEKEESSRY